MTSDQITVTTELICSGCRQPVEQKPPRGWITRDGQPPPDHSHLDGEPICAAMTRDGYRSADPIPAGDQP